MPLSKSISNRLMLLEFLHGNHNLEEWASSSLDSQRLLAILKLFPEQSDIDVGDAGTVARFITGLCATQPGRIFTIKGTPRMHQRPIADLIEALRGLGAHIECLDKDGFLPIRVEGKALDGDALKINVSRSSQFLSSVLLLAPRLPLPLRIELLGKPVSRPYVAMTIALLADYGFGVVEEESSLTVHRTEKKKPPRNRSEGDWSAAFYLLLINSLVPESDVVVSNLKWSSLQGDRYVDHILEPLGLGIFKDDRGIGLTTVKNEEPKKVQLNFLNCPDLAQPFIAYCAAKRITGDFTGLATLKHKESDRVEAMYNELRKVGVEVRKTTTSLSIVGFNENSNAIPVSIKTYEDHRMAMSFFLLQLMNPALVIEAPEVVEKSFPEFWTVLASLGLKFEMIQFMQSNTFGKALAITTFGESHGPMIGVTIDGFPPGIDIDLAYIQREMDRRKPGQSKITTQRQEDDQVNLVSGVFEGKSTGHPITLLIKNKDQRSKDYSNIKDTYRPSHADFTYQQKYGIRDYKGGGRSSARETATRVAAGALAKTLLKNYEISISAFVSQVASVRLTTAEVDYDLIEDNLVRCPNKEVAQKMIDEITIARNEGDSLGGVVSCHIHGVPVGLGEPIFDRLEADLAKGMMSLPAAKGFEIGSGFGAAEMKGSSHNDSFETDSEGKVTTKTNYSGGVQGGISNGQPIQIKVAFKPVATIGKKQETVDREGHAVILEAKGRHDPCVVPRAVPIVEAMAALVIADHLLRNNALNDFRP